LKDYLLKDAAKILGINYSTAKTILRIFRIEKRIEKKNADEERQLKEIIFKFKKDKNDELLLPVNERSISLLKTPNEGNLSVFLFNNIICYSGLITFKIIFILQKFNFLDVQTEDTKQNNNYNSSSRQTDHTDSDKKIHSKLQFLYFKINEYKRILDNCKKQLVTNQNVINLLMLNLPRLKEFIISRSKYVL
jgi:hypothetical protein